jgi:hypothetical protein
MVLKISTTSPTRAAPSIEPHALIEVTRNNGGSARYKPLERLESAKGRSNIPLSGLHPDANDLNLSGTSLCDCGEEPLLGSQGLTRGYPPAIEAHDCKALGTLVTSPDGRGAAPV